ncbi:MAG: SGNH/GDSL hydrolase family protein [Bacteroidia bacterium]
MKRRRLFTGLLLLAALLGVGSSLLLYQTYRRLYRELWQTRLDPLGLRRLPEAVPDTSAGRIVMYGDSRAEAWPAPALPPGYAWYNRGIGGHTTAQCLLRWDRHVALLAPDLVVVQAGVNDCYAIGLLPGAGERIAQQAQTHLGALVDTALRQGATVILTTIFPPGPPPWYRRPFWSPDIGAAIDATNDFVRRQARPGVYVLDTGPLLSDDGRHTAARYRSDDLHLNAQGYARLNTALDSLLRSLPGQ